jgi:hypothetical protein
MLHSRDGYKGSLDQPAGSADHRGTVIDPGRDRMLRKLAGDCSDGVTCPAVYAEDEETVIVQGYEVASITALPPAPDGETRVRLPRAMLLEAARELT